jgi:type I restriction enzyme, R subunit
VPTDAYELDTAVADSFLVPPKVQQVDMKFPREGIAYDTLSDAEKAQWESLDWGDEANETGLPDRVNAAAINSWLFNEDTVDKVLQYLMENGHKVEGGDRLAKTIVFARGFLIWGDHAVFPLQQVSNASTTTTRNTPATSPASSTTSPSTRRA